VPRRLHRASRDARLIRKCALPDEDQILCIINVAAKAYEGVIPDDCYHEPYMSRDELHREIDRMTFFGFEEKGELVGVTGLQPVEDVTLIRHSYVLPEHQHKGIGTKLLRRLAGIADRPRLLVGTWADASWAIRFYENLGFQLLPNKDELLRRYWKIPQRQIENSVVLGMNLKSERQRSRQSILSSYHVQT